MSTPIIAVIVMVVVLGGLFAFGVSKKMSMRQIEPAPVADLALPGVVTAESAVPAQPEATESVSKVEKVEVVSQPAIFTGRKEDVGTTKPSGGQAQPPASPSPAPILASGLTDVKIKTTVKVEPSSAVAFIPSQTIVSPPAVQPITESTPQPVSSVTSQPIVQPTTQPPVSSRVFINVIELSASQMAEFKKTYGVPPEAGRYWYDKVSGAYGNLGGSTAGFMYPGHNYGKMPAHASNGNTGVFFNGRQLDNTDYMIVSAIIGIPAVSGRYFFDSLGNVGYEGTAIALVNLYTAPGTSSGGGGDNFWSSRFSAGNYNSQGQGYVSVPGYGPVGYGF